MSRYPETQLRNAQGQAVLLQSGGVTVVDATPEGGEYQLYMSEHVGEITLPDGRKVEFSRNPFGRPQYIVDFAKDDPKHPGASIMIDLQEALTAAIGIADEKLPGPSQDPTQ